MAPRIWRLAGAQCASATGAYAFTGLLGPLAAEFGVSLATVGQLGTGYALAYAICGAPAATLTVRINHNLAMRQSPGRNRGRDLGA